MKLFTKDINQKLFAQYRIGSDLNKQKVVAKIFNPYGIGRWYLLNSDPNDPDYLWAIVQMGDNVEIGSVSRSELERARIKPFGLPLERDTYFSDRVAIEVLEGLEKGQTFAAGGMTAGRWYKDNSGKEFRFIGESEGKLLFKDGEKIITKSEEDFEDAPKEKKLFGIFAKGGETPKEGELVKGFGHKYSTPIKEVNEKNKTFKIDSPNYWDFDDVLISFDKVVYSEDDNEWVHKMAEGGETEDEGVDLFEDYDDIPKNVQKILEKYDFEEGDYRTLEKAKKDVEKVGYTFEYSLDGTAYDLRKIGEKGKSGDEYAKGGLVTLYDDYDKDAGYIIEKENKYWTGKNWSDVKAYAESYKTKQEAEKKLKSIKMAKGGLVKINISDIEDSDFQSLSQIFESNDAAFSIDEAEEYVSMDLKGLPDGNEKQEALEIIGKYDVQRMDKGGKINWGEDLGDGFSIGNDVYIKDSSSRFYNKNGYLVGKIGQRLVVRVGNDEMDAVVAKDKVQKLDAPMAKGGNINSDLSDKELKDLVDRLSKEKTLDKKEEYALMKAKYMLEKRDSSNKMAEGGKVLDLKDVYNDLRSKVGRLEIQEETKDYINCDIRDWGNWEHDYQDYERDEEDFEDDDFMILSESSGKKMQSIVEEIRNKYPTVSIKWNTSEKNYIDFNISRKMAMGGSTPRTIKLTLSDKDSYDYTYKQDGATASITFGFGKEPFQYEVKKISKSLEPLKEDILDAFTIQGIKQHEYKGGFSEAIKHLDTKVVYEDKMANGGMIELQSVGAIYNPQTKMIYAKYSKDEGYKHKGKEYDVESGLNVDEIDDQDFLNALSKEDKAILFGNKMAEGGMVQHGLKIGDKITTDMFWDNQIVVENQKTKKRAQINLETGERKEEMAEGGQIEVGDKIKSKSGISGIVYESSGGNFKLKDEYGNKNNKYFFAKDFKKSEIIKANKMADGGDTAAAEHNIKQAKYGAKMSESDKLKDYTKMKDSELLALNKKLLTEVKPIPLSLIKELNKRGLKKSYIGTFNSNMARGGKVKFEDKVKAVKESLLKRKKVSPKVQKDYGKTYDRKEALEAAKRIVGAQTAKYELKKNSKKAVKQ